MQVEINVTEAFKRAAKPLIKKYRSFVDDLTELEAELIAKPESGISLGNGVYKIRLRIKMQRKGKEGWGKGYFVS